MKLLVVAFLIGAASSFKISSEEDLIKRFGEKNVSFDPSVRWDFQSMWGDETGEIVCSGLCTATSALRSPWPVTSSGGTAEHQSNRLGRFTVAGSLWDNMVPLWKAENDQWITPDALSNPIINDGNWEIAGPPGTGKNRHFWWFNPQQLCPLQEWGMGPTALGSTVRMRSLTSGNICTNLSGMLTPLSSSPAPRLGRSGRRNRTDCRIFY